MTWRPLPGLDNIAWDDYLCSLIPTIRWVYSQDCTFFTKKEILHIHKRFRELFADAETRNITLESKLSIDDILKLPELKVNPFRKRICQVFRSGGMILDRGGGGKHKCVLTSVYGSAVLASVYGSAPFLDVYGGSRIT